jgi:hypothetical protein
MSKQLLIGCGSNKTKQFNLKGKAEWDDLTTLDYISTHNPDVIADLNDPLPFKDNTFHEIHAYEVLEHLHSQGDYKAFFAEFTEYWRILKNNGLFFASVPWWQSNWAWGDPSHTRVILPETLVFLNQSHYDGQVGTTAMSDFRSIYKADFEVVFKQVRENAFYFALRARKE